MYRVENVDPIKLPPAMSNLVGYQVIKLHKVRKTMYRVDVFDPIKLPKAMFIPCYARYEKLKKYIGVCQVHL